MTPLIRLVANPIFLGSILVLQFAITVAAEPTSQRPNIVFFLADDQTTSTLGCYGNSIIQTPNIDALAARGTRFKNALVSQSICWMSRVTLMSGLTGRTFGTRGDRELARPETVNTLVSDRLHAAGYRTGYFGKWHAKMPPGYRPQDHFDTFEAIARNPYMKRMPDGTLRHETDLIVDRGIEFLDQQPSDQPFALNLWFNAAHAEDSDRRPGFGVYPWPPSSNDLYTHQTFDPPRLSDPTIFDALPETIKVSINRERFFWRWDSPQRYQTNMQAYYRMVSGIDTAIGRFMKALEEHGMLENTIVIYSADNGYYMGNRGLAGKWLHHEESLHVPLIIVDPRRDTKSLIQQAALNVDLPATMLDWAGVEIPSSYQGESLVDVINGDAQDQIDRETFHEHFAVRNRIAAFEAIRTPTMKYARYIDSGDEFLHDLASDLDEIHNRVSDPSYQSQLTTLRTRLDEMIADVGGPLESPTTPFSPSTVPHPDAAVTVSIPTNRDGDIELTNKSNLRQWAFDKDAWKLEQGTSTIVAKHSSTPATISWKGQTVQNFELTFEVQSPADAKLQIVLRGEVMPGDGYEIGGGYVFDIPMTNDSTWSTVHCVANGDRIEVRSNDEALGRVENKVAGFDQMPRDGVLAFTAASESDGEIRIRNLTLTPLADNER